MINKTLLITNLTEDIDYKFSENESIFTYNFNSGKVLSKNFKNLNNAKILNVLALSEKENYSSFIYSKNKLFLSENLIFNNNLSLYFLSIFSNKRTEFFNTYNYYLHILILRSVLKETSFNSICCIGFSDRQIDQLSLNLGCDIKSINRSISVNYKYLAFKNFIFYFKAIFYLTFIKLFLKNNNFPVNKVFFANFPKHFESNLKQKKYGNLTQNPENSFLLSLISDGFHQNLNLKDFVKALFYLKGKSQDKKFNVLDLYLSYKDIVWSLKYFFKINKSYKKLTKVNHILNGVILNNQIKSELELSFYQTPRILMYFKAYMRFFEETKPKQMVYYLHEYSLGRFISYILRNYFPQIKSYGFQHGPISKRKMLYALAKFEVCGSENNLYNVPLPMNNYCEDIYSKKIYESYGYSNLIINDRIQRLDYLNFVKREQIKLNTCLVACGLHDANNIIDYVLKSKIYLEKKIFIKLHPYSQNKVLIKKITSVGNQNLTIATKPLTEYFNFVEEVISTYSSVGYEAYYLGIKTTLLVFNYKINESPLLEIENKDSIKIIYA